MLGCISGDICNKISGTQKLDYVSGRICLVTITDFGKCLWCLLVLGFTSAVIVNW